MWLEALYLTAYLKVRPTAASRDFPAIARLFCRVPDCNGQWCIARVEMKTGWRRSDWLRAGRIIVYQATYCQRLIDMTCCSVRRWLLVVSACCRCGGGGRSVCWYLVQSSSTDHICNLRPRRHSCCTLCSEKKHPLSFSSISLWVICRFKQKLQWIYLRNGRFSQCRN